MSRTRPRSPSRREPSAALAGGARGKQTAQARFEEAVRRHVAGDRAAAETAYRAAIALEPGHPEAHNNLAALHADRDEVPAALELVARAIELNPTYGEALHNLGLLHSRQREFRPAVAAFRRAVECEAHHAGWWNDLGNAHLELFECEEALEAYDTALRLDPVIVESASNRATALRGLRRPDEALEACDHALGIDPSFTLAESNKGLILKEMRRFDEAVESLTSALARHPGDPAVLTNLAVVHLELADLDEAKRRTMEALSHHPEYVDAHNVLGNCAMEEGDYAGSLEWYRRAAALRPDDANANWNQALIHLIRGEFEEGWAKFGWRTQLQSVLFDRHRDTTPEWDGSPLDGRSILLHAEQGLGDTLQFVRYAAVLKEHGAGTVILTCPAGSEPLLERVGGVDLVVAQGAPLPPHDLHAYLMSVPAVLGARPGNIPDRVPYLPVEPRPVADLVADEPGVLKVGIVWAGGILHQRDRIRSVGIDHFRALFGTPGVRFYSLQKGPREEDLTPADGVVSLSPYIADFLDTAAAIDRLDLVITVDTSVAHLAGGLGCPTWVLLPFVSDWRWMIDRTDSPWYPTMRLFRQPALGDWGSAVASLREELAARAAAGPDQRPRVERTPAAPPAPFRFSVHPEPEATPAVPANEPIEELELCTFLRESLRPGDLYLDYAPGAASTALAAATAGGAPVIPLLLLERSADAADRLRDRMERYGLGSVATVMAAGPGEIPPLGSLAGTRAFLRVGEAGGAAEILRASAPLQGTGSLASILWPAASAPSLDWLQLALPVGYTHCTLALRGGELDVDPLSATDSDLPVVSLADWFLAELEGGPAVEPMVEAVVPPAPLRVGRPDTAAATVLGIDWAVGMGTGWGTYGLNLSLELLARGDAFPVLLAGAGRGELSPLARHHLRPALERSAEIAGRIAGAGGLATLDFPLLRGLGNKMEGVTEPGRLRGSADVGMIFFEDTAFSSAALDRARALDHIVAGSTWNAEVLRGYGLENVSVSLQGIDPTVFHPAPRSGHFGDRFVVYSGGKLEYRKGQDIVIAAFREFRRRHPEALLLFAWHNHWPSNMEEIPFGGHVQGLPSVAADGTIDFAGWLVANGLPADSFIDLGAVPNARMGQLLREADVALFTNRCEGGTNLVAMEAMACGLPTILSRNTGHLDLVGDDRCYPLAHQGPVHPSNHCVGQEGWGESSVEEILEMLERVHADRQEAAARGLAASRFMERFSWRERVAGFLDSIAPLLQRSTRS